MKKFIIFIVVLALIWAIPPVRTRLGAAAVPLLEKLGPLGELVINPARGYAASQKVQHIVRLIEADRTEGRQLPEARGFAEWLKRRIPNETGLDPWSNPYWMERARGPITIGSDGADGERGTSDDIKQTVQF